MYSLTLLLLLPSVCYEATDWILTKHNSGPYTRVPEHDCALESISLAASWEVAVFGFIDRVVARPLATANRQYFAQLAG